MPNPRRRIGTNKSRRELLALLGVGSAAGLAGCLSGDDDDESGTDDDESGTDDDESGTDDDESGDTGSQPDVNGTYDAVTHATFTTLNPLYNNENNAGTAIGYALDQGYTFDENNDYFPLLYDMSTEDEGQVWVFEIRDGLEFSEPYGQVTAESFVYQIQELHQGGWANTINTLDWQGVNVEQTGELEFQAELPEARLLWPESYEPLLYPIPKDLVEPYVEDEDVEGLEQDEELLELQFTGNLGPFVLDEWNRGSGTSYSRNDDYYIQNIDEGPDLFEGAPYFEGASIDVVEEESSRIGSLQAGEADYAEIPPERFQELDNDSNVSTYQVPQPYNRIISVNMRDNGWNAGPGNLFRYKEFRQALACAIGKDELIQGVYRGLAEPHFTWQPRFSDYYPGDDDLPTYGTGDLYGSEPARERAEEAFEQSEHDYAFDGDTMVNPDGDQVVLDIYHSSGAETSQLMAEFISEELGENLGIQVVVEAIDGRRFDTDYFSADPEGGEDEDIGVTWENPNAYNPGPRSVTSNEPWDMSIVYGLNTYPLNPITNDAFFDGATAGTNPVGYYPSFDAEQYFTDAKNAESGDEIAEIFQEFFVEIAEDQPYIMLLFADDLYGYNPDLVGPIENFMNGWDFPAWRFDQ